MAAEAGFCQRNHIARISFALVVQVWRDLASALLLLGILPQLRNRPPVGVEHFCDPGVVTLAEHPVVAAFEKLINHLFSFCNVQILSLGCSGMLSATGMATNGMGRPCEWLWRKLALFTA